MYVVSTNEKWCKLGKLFNNHKADDKIFSCKFSENIKSKLYHIENAKTRG